MARSGSYDWSLAGDAIIRGAIRIVKGMGGSPPDGNKSAAEEITDGREALNMMLKDWQSQGMGLWLNKEIIVFLAYHDGEYSLGSSGDHATLTLVETELSSSAASGASSIEVDSDDGISDGDVIGIELDDNTLQWTTVNGTPSSDTVALDAALTDDCAENNNVYTYTTKSQRPLEVRSASLYHDDGTETPLYMCSRQEWDDLPNKSYNGVPSQVYYDPQLDSGILNVWPRPSTVDNYIKLNCRYPIQDIDAAANDPDFPAEVQRAVKFNLAVDIAPEYNYADSNTFIARYQLLERKAAELFNSMMAYDTEYGSYFFEAEDAHH